MIRQAAMARHATQCAVLSTQSSRLSAQYSVPSTLHSVRSTQCLVLWVVTLAATVVGCSTLHLPVSAKRESSREKEQQREQVVQTFEQRRNEAQCRAALARWQQGDAAGCKSLLLQLLAHSPGDREAQRLLADLYLAEEKPAEALQQLQALVKQHPDDAQAHHSLGLLLESLGHTDQAIEHFELAVELEPKNELYTLSRDAASE